MPRVNYVKKARASTKRRICQASGREIQPGDAYLWWKFRFGPKFYRLAEYGRPRRSSLTQSPFFAALFDWEDDLSAADAPEPGDFDSTDEYADAVSSVAEDWTGEQVDALQELSDEAQASLDNIPEQLQDTSPAGETLTQRIESLEEWVNEIESLDTTFDPDDDLTGDDLYRAAQEWLDALVDQVKELNPGF